MMCSLLVECAPWGRSGLFQESGDPDGQATQHARFGLALPYDHHPPAQPPQLPHNRLVTGDVSIEFRQPVFPPRGRFSGAPFASVLMPEASMHENNLPPPDEDQIGLAGQVFAVQAKSIPQPMGEFADDQFRFGVFRPHPLHDPAAFFPGENIHGGPVIGDQLSFRLADFVQEGVEVVFGDPRYRRHAQ